MTAPPSRSSSTCSRGSSPRASRSSWQGTSTHPRISTGRLPSPTCAPSPIRLRLAGESRAGRRRLPGLLPRGASRPGRGPRFHLDAGRAESVRREVPTASTGFSRQAPRRPSRATLSANVTAPTWTLRSTRIRRITGASPRPLSSRRPSRLRSPRRRGVASRSGTRSRSSSTAATRWRSPAPAPGTPVATLPALADDGTVTFPTAGLEARRLRGPVHRRERRGGLAPPFWLYRPGERTEVRTSSEFTSGASRSASPGGTRPACAGTGLRPTASRPARTPYATPGATRATAVTAPPRLRLHEDRIEGEATLGQPASSRDVRGALPPRRRVCSSRA